MNRVLTLSFVCLPVLLLTLRSTVTAQSSCTKGDNLQNAGGSCNFGTVTLTLCDWVNMEANNLTWRADYNDVNLSPCILTDTKDLNMNQIVRLKSPLLCATNSTAFDYLMQFSYSIYSSDRCRFSLSVFSAAGDKLYEVWNTQETTYDSRSRGWKTQTLNISNSETPFYLIFAAERISATETTTVALDTLSYTSQPVTTTTTSTTTTTTIPSSTPSPQASTSTSTKTTTTTPTTTSTTTSASTTTEPRADNSVGGEDDTLIWGLTLDIVIAIGVGAFLVILIIVIICITVACRRAKREDDVKTVSFQMASPNAYNVNEKPKRRGTKAGRVLASKQKTWEPDMSLY